MISALELADPEIAEAVRKEAERQASTIDLIAAVNFPSRAVMEVQSSVFAVRSAEGYPGRRFHAGARLLDVIEDLARERAKKLFGAEHANVQPSSGVNANLAVFFAALQPGDRTLGMELAHGGHLSHGHRATLSGKYFQPFLYGVDPKSELIDYDQAMDIAVKERPKMVICGASAYPRAIDFGKMREIADRVGASLLADVAHYAGLVAGGAYPSPVPYADFVTFTTYKTLRGCRGGAILCKKEWAKKIDSAIFPGVQGSPHMNYVAAKAVTFRLAMTQEFRDYAHQVVANARVLAKVLQQRGYHILTGGTDCHIVLVDVRARNITGKQAQEALESAGITCNKNEIPFDPRGAEVTSGIRLGSQSMTTKGFHEADMEETADVIDAVLSHPEDEKTLQNARERVKHICARFPWLLDRFEAAARTES